MRKIIYYRSFHWAFIGPLYRLITDGWIDWFIDRLIDWMIHRPVDSLIFSNLKFYGFSPINFLLFRKHQKRKIHSRGKIYGICVQKHPDPRARNWESRPFNRPAVEKPPPLPSKCTGVKSVPTLSLSTKTTSPIINENFTSTPPSYSSARWRRTAAVLSRSIDIILTIMSEIMLEVSFVVNQPINELI